MMEKMKRRRKKTEKSDRETCERDDRAERERLRSRGMSCAFNAHLARRCNKIDILILLNLRMPVS